MCRHTQIHNINITQPYFAREEAQTEAIEERARKTESKLGRRYKQTRHGC